MSHPGSPLDMLPNIDSVACRAAIQLEKYYSCNEPTSLQACRDLAALLKEYGDTMIDHLPFRVLFFSFATSLSLENRNKLSLQTLFNEMISTFSNPETINNFAYAVDFCIVLARVLGTTHSQRTR